MIERARINEWMARAADGDRDALEPLFAALWGVAARYAERLVGGDRALAEDCAQEALVRLFEQLGRFDRSRDGLAWALALVTWSCRTARRTRGRAQARTGTAAVEPSLDGLDAAEQRDLVRAALAALESLSAADVETIAAAIADAAPPELSPPTFRKRVERAFARLRTAWRTRHGSI